MSEPSTPTQPFTSWTVFSRSSATSPSVGKSAAPALSEAVGQLEPGVTVRGFYDVSTFRQDADILVWLHAENAQLLQDTVRLLSRTRELGATGIAWSAVGVHREAEFTKDHSPSFYRGVDPVEWMCVYPFVRSYEWYLLPAEERRAMLAEHGREGREFPQILSNTVQSFALGDWEWLLALEAEELTDLVDMMRHLRATQARMHVREEVPFYTGRLVQPQDVAELLR